MKIVIFGASGTVGGGVLKVCLSSPMVEEARAIIRRPLTASHDKLYTFQPESFLNFTAMKEAFADVAACFYCLGVSATQVPGEREYRKITHDFALAAAQMLKRQSPEALFHFISGQGTRPDSRFMWARVKAETERDLLALGNALCWRPGYIAGELSAGSPKSYRVLRPLAKLLKPFRGVYIKAEDIGRAMLQATRENIRGRTIGNAEIRALARRCS
jgi:uncharacterized protein YbjT (DUF2867 family)